MGRARRLLAIATLTTGALAAGAAPAAAEEFTVRTLHFATVTGPGDTTRCDIVGDLYRPASATRATPAPAILTTNGFGGSKDDQAEQARAYASRGYVVLSYSGLGFGGSGCKITLDDRDYDGKAGSQLVTFLGGGSKAVDGTRVDYVRRDRVGSDGRAHPNDPRLGMIGGSYGGQVQFAIAGIDPRVDTIVPIITWNDLSYSLAPNNTSLSRGVTYDTPGIEKFQWVSLFFGVGIQQGIANAAVDPSRLVGLCPNFDDRACIAKAQMDATGAPDAATLAFARHASVSTFLDDIRIPTLLAQGQADTLFNLQEAVATYQGLRARGVPVKMMWQSWGHSRSKPAPGELDQAEPETTYQGRQFLAWFDHYLKDAPAAPSLDFTFFRDWEPYTGDATPAYGRAPTYPIGQTRDLFLSGNDALTADGGAVAPGAASFTTTTAGAPTSYTETSALDQSQPVRDLPGTFAQFAGPPLAEDTDVVGVPTVDVRLAAPTTAATGALGAPGDLAVFFKLYDLAPDGAITLVNRLISPVRVADTSKPIRVELPGIVHRFPKGHRVALVVAGGDSAYRGNAVAGPVQVLTDPAHPGVLHLPVAAPGSYGKVVEAAVPPRLPGATCVSRRSFTVMLRRGYRKRVRSTLVLVNGRRVASLGRRTRARVDFRGRPRSTVTVKLVMRLADGRRVTDTRRYRLCVTR